MTDNVVGEVIEWLQEEINTLTDEINVRNQTIDSLQKLLAGLKDIGDSRGYKEKLENTEEELEKEQKRLVKLHDHYRKTEEECKTLRKELKNWNEWFNSNRDIYERLFSAAPPKELTESEEKLPDKKKKDKKK